MKVQIPAAQNVEGLHRALLRYGSSIDLQELGSNRRRAVVEILSSIRCEAFVAVRLAGERGISYGG